MLAMKHTPNKQQRKEFLKRVLPCRVSSKCSECDIGPDDEAGRLKAYMSRDGANAEFTKPRLKSREVKFAPLCIQKGAEACIILGGRSSLPVTSRAGISRQGLLSTWKRIVECH